MHGANVGQASATRLLCRVLEERSQLAASTRRYRGTRITIVRPRARQAPYQPD